jgi:hypothetical protein
MQVLHLSAVNRSKLPAFFQRTSLDERISQILQNGEKVFFGPKSYAPLEIESLFAGPTAPSNKLCLTKEHA